MTTTERIEKKTRRSSRSTSSETYKVCNSLKIKSIRELLLDFNPLETQTSKGKIFENSTLIGQRFSNWEPRLYDRWWAVKYLFNSKYFRLM